MKRILFAIAAFMLIFGCISLPGVTPGNVTVSPLPNVTIPGTNATVTPPAPGCTPSYSFTAPQSTMLSATGSISGTATCADGKVVSAYVNGAQAGQATVSGSPASVSISIPATQDGTNTVSVKVGGSEVYSSDWTVTPLGYLNTGGTDNDRISIKDWKAVSFNVVNPITVKKVGAYLRQLQQSTLQGTQIVVDIRADAGGAPASDYIATSELPINRATMTPNWIYFPMDAQLQSGKYWVVFRIDQPSTPVVSDSVNLQYYAVDKLKPGNADNLQMSLNRNQQTESWDQTSWVPAGYDRKYSFSVSASD